MSATIVVGLAMGDEGKGSIVEFLCNGKSNCTIVRFNGGAQAGHNVVLEDGSHHTFSQFGSGTLAGARTHLSRFMLIDPPALWNEAQHLIELGVKDPFGALTIDRDCLVVTPFHKAANRLRELARGANPHGTCGMGIGEAMADRLALADDCVTAKDLLDRGLLSKKLKSIQERKHDAVMGLGFNHDDSNLVERFVLDWPDEPEAWAYQMHSMSQHLSIVDGAHLKRLAVTSDLVFEGAQGVLLDEDYGFHPNTTWSRCTPANALALLREIDYSEPIETIGVLRSYFTRHGRGPFPTYDKHLTETMPDAYNGDASWQGEFRVGAFDAVLARYAITSCEMADRPNCSIAMTHWDRFPGLFCNSYESQKAVIRDIEAVHGNLAFQETLGKFLDKVVPVVEDAPAMSIEAMERHLGVPISIVSSGQTAHDKKRRLELISPQ